MAPEKIVWYQNDTFDTMHKLIKSLVGCHVVNRGNPEKPYTIFKVSDIEKDENQYVGFVDKDDRFRTVVDDVWVFTVEYGFQEKKGVRISWRFRFTIPRKSETSKYKSDLKKNQIVFYKAHDFIEYQIQTKRPCQK